LTTNRGIAVSSFVKQPPAKENCQLAQEKQGIGSQGKMGARVLGELRKHLSRMLDDDKVLLVFIAEKMAGRNSGCR